MTAPPRSTPAVKRALALVAKGMTAYAAAKKTGIAMSTIYRALKRQRAAIVRSIPVYPDGPECPPLPTEVRYTTK